MKKYLYMPIETKVRELDSRILLALEAAKGGFISVIGTKMLMHKLKHFPFPKGIFLYKDSIHSMEHTFKKIQKRGHKIVIHDEEGFVQFNWKDYLDTRILSNTLKYVDTYLCWGKKQYEAILSIKDTLNSRLLLEITGHPRIDILREPIRKYNQLSNQKNDKMILINMKFGPINYINTSLNYFEKQIRDNPSMSEVEQQELKDLIDYKEKLLKYYNILIEKMILKFPKEIIVIRPHPIENIEYWKKRYEKYPNILISNDYSIGYWLNQASVVLHTGCTTAIEGFIMGVPVITYHPFIDHRFEIKLPDSVSFHTETEEGCLNKIESLLAGNYDKISYEKVGYSILKEHLANLKKNFSSPEIIKVLNKQDIKKKDYSFLTKLQMIFGFGLLENLLKIKNYFNRIKVSLEPEDIISEDEVKSIIEKFKSATGDNTNYIISQLSKNTVVISVQK